MLVGGVLYAGAGFAYNRKVKGAEGLEALPHQAFWMELRAMVMDGVAFARGGGHGGGAREPLRVEESFTD